MPTKENFSNTAKNCSSYSPNTNVSALTNSTVESTSCLNCTNYIKNHCQLDLYDEINNTD